MGDPGVPSPLDQTFKPFAKAGGMNTMPSVIALFIEIPFPIAPQPKATRINPVSGGMPRTHKSE
ncbi:hypothetical protein NBRC116589_16150 [Ruegeria sp. HU-ET01832]